jgi:ubiquinone/menaquinone biosynthesis C-methylase UbiE
MKLAEERYKLIDAGTVLDVATGRGEFVVVIKNDFKSYEHIVGIDISAQTIKHTQTLFPENNIEILRMSADNIEFADEHFDTVCISNSLHHLEHRDQSFKEMMRVLNPAGCSLLQKCTLTASNPKLKKLISPCITGLQMLIICQGYSMNILTRNSRS